MLLPQASLKVTFFTPHSSGVPVGVKMAAFRAVQEALNNAFRHAGGQGQRLCVALDGEEPVLEVSDVGPGPGEQAGAPGGA